MPLERPDATKLIADLEEIIRPPSKTLDEDDTKLE